MLLRRAISKPPMFNNSSLNGFSGAWSRVLYRSILTHIGPSQPWSIPSSQQMCFPFLIILFQHDQDIQHDLHVLHQGKREQHDKNQKALNHPGDGTSSIGANPAGSDAQRRHCVLLPHQHSLPPTFILPWILNEHLANPKQCNFNPKVMLPMPPLLLASTFFSPTK